MLGLYCADLISLHAPTPTFEFLYASAASRILLGCEEGALLGTSILDKVHADDLIAWHAASSRAAAGLVEASTHGVGGSGSNTAPGTTTTMEYRLHRSDGLWVWVETVLMGAGGRGYVCVTREITQRREAETNTTAMMLEITARHEMQLSALLSASFAVALLVTPDSTTLHLSDSARDELGLTTSADDPTPLSELSLAIPHADIEQLHAVLTSARVEAPLLYVSHGIFLQS